MTYKRKKIAPILMIVHSLLYILQACPVISNNLKAEDQRLPVLADLRHSERCQILGMSETLCDHAPYIDTVLKILDVDPLFDSHRPNHTAYTTFEQFQNVLENNFGREDYRAFSKQKKQRLKTALSQLGMTQQHSLKTVTKTSDHDKALLIFLGAHPKSLCHSLNVLTKTQPLVEGTLVIGTSQTYPFPGSEVCPEYYQLLNNKVDMPESDSHYVTQQHFMVKLLNTVRIQTFSLYPPESYYPGIRNTNNNNHLYEFLSTSHKIYRQYSKVIVIAHQPFVKEAMLILTDYFKGTGATLHLATPPPTIDIEECLQALMSWIIRDYDLNPH